jgi:hypothetical protein
VQIIEKTALQTANAKIASKEFLDNAGNKINDATVRTKVRMADAGAKIKLSAFEASHKAREAMKRATRSRIGDMEDAPVYQVDNEFIKNGYRINHGTCWRSLKSLFTCHNESVNVWSHLLGAIFFFGLFLILCIFVIPQQF